MSQQPLFPYEDNGGTPLPPLDSLRPSELGPIAVDTETTGLHVFGRDTVVGVSIADEHQAFYLPFAHEAGENYEAKVVKAWLAYHLRGRELLFANARFDVHFLRKFGVDVEALGCRVRDVQHAAALLEEKRHGGVSLDNLGKSILGVGKVHLPDDGRKIHELPSHVVAPYAAKDAWLTYRLHDAFKKDIEVQGLRKVLDLEDDLVFATCEMERNGAPIDTDQLEKWRAECVGRYQRVVLDIWRLTGMRVIPTAPTDLAKLYHLLRLPYDLTLTGQPSFTWETLKRDAIGRPAVALALEGRQIASLQSKYLDKYAVSMAGGKILRYELNQLRADVYGTRTGRYSSSNVNIQQVFSDENQFLPEYMIRELFVPHPGKLWFSADASQIEFRIFAHYSKSEKLINAYAENPNTDFHQIVADMIGLPRKDAKHINFGRVYGMGRDKMALQMGRPREEVDPLFDAYTERFPEAGRLLREAATLAEHRGYVRTALGRRRRWIKKIDEKYHSALNAVIQGTAADIMKLKLLEVYRERKALGLTLRFTVHDELDGDLDPDPRYATRLKEVLDAPALEMRVPILWTVKTGKNWRLK